jgi:two-component system CheB/CheR fusion protein
VLDYAGTSMGDRPTESPELEHLLEYLKQTRGFEFTAYKRATLARRIAKRMGSVGAGTYDDYVDYLEVHPDEFAQLFNAVLINVTAFFRDTQTFEYLRTDVLPEVMKARAPDDQIRVWSAGCASGEECYSIAVLLAEAIGPDQYRDRVKIYATDVDEEELAIARQAIYTDRQIDSVPAELRQKYFDRNGTRWAFKKEFRRNVIFGRHDLLDDAPISRVDLLLCRNTLMYFNQEAQARIVSRFHFALREGGYLVLGKAEMLLAFAGSFVPVDLRQRIFVKTPIAASPEAVLASYAPGRDERPPTAGMSSRLRDVVFDHDSTAQIVLDQRGHLLLANVRARELFGLRTRDLGRPLQDLELSYRPADLRSCVDDAHARRTAVQLRDVAWPLSSGEARFFTVQVMPVLDGTESVLGTKIVFADVTRQHELQDELQRSRQELETAYEELQSTNEELETTNEELQSTVEELETTNEELQSTNEELETMNEELQSTNEELETVNEELRQRGVDLARSNVFLSGILRSVPLGVVVLNDDLRVELWNDVAADMWGLRQDEVHGRHFLGLDIGIPLERLRQPLLTVLQAPDRPAELTVAATTRRGRSTMVRVVCVSAGSAADHGRGVILLMQEAPSEVVERTH